MKRECFLEKQRQTRWLLRALVQTGGKNFQSTCLTSKYEHTGEGIEQAQGLLKFRSFPTKAGVQVSLSPSLEVRKGLGGKPRKERG